MPQYKLTYFTLPMRAEAIRLTLVTGGADWEDKRVTLDEWKVLKPMFEEASSNTPFRFPWLPHLEVPGEDIVISQSLPALRFLARRFGLDGANEAEKVMVESILEIYNDLFSAYCPIKFVDEPAERVKKFEDVIAKNGCFLETILKNNRSNGYLVGKQLTVADIAIYSVLREASKILEEKTKASIDWSKFQLLKAHHEKIAKEPKIHAYYSK